MKKSKIKTNPMDQAIQVLIYIVVIALCLVILLPCINVVALAFNDGADAARGGIWFWPREFTLGNFKKYSKMEVLKQLTSLPLPERLSEHF